MNTPSQFTALPPSGKGPGLLVMHPWWGLNDFIKAFCQRLSREGFLVLAPDLYHGHVATTIEGAAAIRDKMKRAQAQQDMQAALAALRSHPGLTTPQVGLIGFSLGAYLGMGLVAEHPEAFNKVVLFYGARTLDLSTSQAAFLGHFAESDPYESPSGISRLEKSLKKAGCPVEFHTYPGTGHWFFESDRTDAYHPAAAELAWQRTLDFLRAA